MAENGASTNGHRPARRRKHIYPPLEQMAAEQAAAAGRPRPARTVRARMSASDVATEAAPEAIEAAPEATEAVAEVADAPTSSVITLPPPAETSLAPLDQVDDGGLDAEHVELRLSAVGMVDADDVHFAQGALGAARAETVSVDRGAVGAALADKVEVSRGYARSILARQVQLDSSAARVVVAGDVRADRSAVMFLVARRVAGDVRVLLDWRGAAAFGAIAGLIIGLLRRGRGERGSR